MGFPSSRDLHHRRVIHAGILLGILLTVGTSGLASPAPSERAVRAAGGIVVYYPRDWSATTAKNGTVVALAGPRRGDVRPGAAMVIVQNTGEMSTLLESGAEGVGPATDLRLLGEQQLTLDRWARYYVRGQGAQATYIMLGIARGGGWIVTVVGTDLVRDPELRLRARVLQHILEALAMPR